MKTSIDILARTLTRGIGSFGILLFVPILLVIGIPVLVSAAPLPEKTAVERVLAPENTGLFFPNVTYASGTAFTNVAVGDFNHDGLDDAALTSGDHETAGLLSVFLQNPSGGINSAITFETDAWIIAMVVADWNGDTYDDLLLSSFANSTINLFLQQPDGSFNAALVLPLSGPALSIAVGDVNNDGRPDLISSSGAAQYLYVYSQKADGTLDDAVTYGAPSGSLFLVRVGDLNGDGLEDVVGSANSGIGLAFYIQQPDGTLADYVAHTLAADVIDGMVVGNLSNDAFADIVVASRYNHTLYVLLQTAAGVFQEPIAVETVSNPDTLRLADVNHDGSNDIVVQHSPGNRISVHRQLVGGGFGASDAYTQASNSAQYVGIDVGDMNHDGLVDVVSHTGGLNVLFHYPVGLTQVMQQDFEGKFPEKGWQVNAGWRAASCNPYQGNQSGWAEAHTGNGCGNKYKDNRQNWMIYGPFSLKKAKRADLYFKLWLQSQPKKDYLFVGFSTNGQNFYGGSYSGNISGGIEMSGASIRKGNEDESLQLDAAPVRELLPTMATPGWVSGHFDLTKVGTLGNLKGKPKVWLGFLWHTDAKKGFTNGVFVDDIILTAVPK